MQPFYIRGAPERQLTVTTHNTRHIRHHAPQKRMCIHLMHRPIVDVRALHRPIVFLLIPDVVLGASLDTGGLDAQHGIMSSFAS